MIQVRTRDVVPIHPDQIGCLREEFDRCHCVRLPKLLPLALLNKIQRQLQDAQTYAKPHIAKDGRKIAEEDCITETEPVVGMLRLLLNRTALFDIIQQMTGCQNIGSFKSRIYRMLPTPNHYDSWHDDANDHRLVGMSLNLSDQIFSGGVFQIKEKKTKKILCEVANTGAGDAILFRIAAHLHHRVTPVTGGAPKTACAGWFVSQPHFKAGFNATPQTDTAISAAVASP